MRSLSLAFAQCSPAPRDVESHSAYWKLGMTAQEGENFILLHRLPKGDKPGDMAVPCLRSPGQLHGRRAGRAQKRSVSPYLRASVTVTQPRAGQAATLRFAICIGTDAQSARDGAARILASGACGGSMPDAAAIHLGMNAAGAWRGDGAGASAVEKRAFKRWRRRASFGVTASPVTCR